MTDSSTKSQQPAVTPQVERPATSSSGSQPPEAPSNNTLPEGFTPWEGSSMAVRQGRHSDCLVHLGAERPDHGTAKDGSTDPNQSG